MAPAPTQQNPPNGHILLAASSRALITTIILGMVLETLLFGIYTTMLVVNVCQRVRSRRSESETEVDEGRISAGRWTKPVSFTSLAIYTLCASHLALTILAYIVATLDSTGGLVGMLILYGTRLAVLEVIRITIEMVTILVGYAALIHRTWVIWNRDFRIVGIPLAMWFGQLGCGISLFVICSRNQEAMLKILSSALFLADWILMISTNVYCTVFSAWKIWSTCRPVAGLRASPFLAILSVIAESQAFLAAWLIVFLILDKRHSAAELAAVDLTPQILGIANIVIHIRVGMQRLPPRTRPPTDGLVLTNPASMWTEDVGAVTDYKHL